MDVSQESSELTSELDLADMPSSEGKIEIYIFEARSKIIQDSFLDSQTDVGTTAATPSKGQGKKPVHTSRI